MINDFNLENKPSTKELKKYEDFLPEDIITLRKDNGFGTFMNGYFKIVNPENYQDILQTTSRRYKEGVVLLTTAMGGFNYLGGRLCQNIKLSIWQIVDAYA